MRIEVCAPNFEIAKAAVEAGADRLEICQALELGGLTPSYSFIEKACSLSVPVRVLIRPRPGNFQYSLDEMEMMLKDIEICQQLEAEGVVIGALNEDNQIDKGTNRIFQESSDQLKFIFHRGVDLAGIEGMKMVYQLGFDGALCSGHLKGLSDGLETMKEYQDLNLSNFELIAGGGLNEENLIHLLEMKIESFHFSCQKALETNKDSYGFKTLFDLMKWERINKILE